MRQTLGQMMLEQISQIQSLAQREDKSVLFFFLSLYHAFYNVNILLPTNALLFNI